MAEPSAQLLMHSRPYPHQVGGHGQLALTTTGLLLKPKEEKEFKFYTYIHSKSLPEHLRWLRTVTPSFYGEIDSAKVSHLCLQSQPSLQKPALTSFHPSLSAQPAMLSSNEALTQDTTSELNSLNLTQSSLCNDSLQTDTVFKTKSSRDNLLIGNLLRPISVGVPQWRCALGDPICSDTVSPWVTKMNVLRRSTSTNTKKCRPNRWIKLEDVNSQFNTPCVMDCKIGTRHYDDDASPEKRQRHIDKANRTTSASCGMRYTGMQSFKRDLRGSHTGVLLTTDKYHGRELKEHDLLPEATWFFHDGFDVRMDCVHMMLERLHKLRRFLLAQHHFYFYSSSLLLVYEGALSEISPTRVDVRMIDFAHTVPSNGDRDEGYLKGISYLIHILTQILTNEHSSRRVLPERATIHSPAAHCAQMPRVHGNSSENILRENDALEQNLTFDRTS